MLTWYFIIYQWQYTSKTTGRTQEANISELITEHHPVEFLVEQRTKHAENDHARYTYNLMFWSEIPSEIAKKYKERFE